MNKLHPIIAAARAVFGQAESDFGKSGGIPAWSHHLRKHGDTATGPCPGRVSRNEVEQRPPVAATLAAPPARMNRRAFFQNLSASLAAGAWNESTLQGTLARRLPPRLHRFCAPLAVSLLHAHPVRYAPPARLLAKTLQSDPKAQSLYRRCLKRGLWPAPDLAGPRFSPLPAFVELDLPELTDAQNLADFLFLPIDRLDYLADRHNRHEEHGETAINHYHYAIQKKRSGGSRVLEAPKQQLKAIQRHILRGILDKIPAPPDAFGFVKGRDCLRAAARHAGEAVVISADLKDFFPSIGAARIFGFFRCLGYPHLVASYLTGLTTSATPPRILHRLAATERDLLASPHLPQGAPTSPALANQAAFSLDRRLAGLARSLGANYSRYADDLTFSGDPAITGPLLKALPEIAKEEGFALNRAKTRVMPHTSRQHVTGLTVNRHINLNRRTFDHLKAVIHACQKPGDQRLNDPQFRAQLLGKIAWAERVNPTRGQKLRRLLER
ncbi:MAG: reverse transcriptase family protein [Pseudomonadota bacterium]